MITRPAAALALVVLFVPTTVGAAQADQSNKITITCLFKTGIMTETGDLSPSPTDKKFRLFAINFVAPQTKPEFVALNTVKIHDPNGLLEGQAPTELMYFKDGASTFSLFTGQKGGVMHSVLGSRAKSPGGSFFGGSFRSGISPSDSRAHAFAGRCSESPIDFEAIKKMPAVSE